ncbi:aminotransferase class V-fold PLP-dependent enzyme [Methanomethylovorans hollandica]|uniref:aminotransferase class V-fold PLP-dependent enzyme n=1 Tax=Methanomethylovorans hollandica TaxID=101192 RepID=UPI002480192B|nr:cysteine desulfurase [Methanomethylovorans hollandica]
MHALCCVGKRCERSFEIGSVVSGQEWQKGDSIVTTILEHHSNFLPWIRLRDKGVTVSLIRPKCDGSLDLSELDAVIDDNTKLVAVTHASNVLGNILPVKHIASICKKHGVKLLVDGAQSVPHLPVNVKDLGCDYLCFSGHKMLGPTGTGILWMGETDINPFVVGGGMIDKVSEEGYTLASGYQRYEAGTSHISGMIGLAEAVDYLNQTDMGALQKREEKLTHRMIKGLSGIDEVSTYGPVDDKDRIGVVSFNIHGLHSHEVAHILDEAAAIMVRSGEHCCQPLMKHLGLEQGTVRASLYLYNTEEEIDLLIATVEEIARRL